MKFNFSKIKINTFLKSGSFNQENYTYRPDWLKGFRFWFWSIVKLLDYLSDVGGGLRLRFGGGWSGYQVKFLC